MFPICNFAFRSLYQTARILWSCIRRILVSIKSYVICKILSSGKPWIVNDTRRMLLGHFGESCGDKDALQEIWFICTEPSYNHIFAICYFPKPLSNSKILSSCTWSIFVPIQCYTCKILSSKSP